MNPDSDFRALAAAATRRREEADEAERKQARAEKLQRKDSWDKSRLGLYLAGEITVSHLEQDVIKAAYPEAFPYFKLPVGYARCKLEIDGRVISQLSEEDLLELAINPSAAIVDPSESQLEALASLQLFLEGNSRYCLKGSPLRPSIGAFFYGPPGTGKSHLMYAFAHEMKRRLDDKLSEWRKMLHQRIKVDIDRCLKLDKKNRTRAVVQLDGVEDESVATAVNKAGIVDATGKTLWQRAQQSSGKLDLDVELARDPMEVLEAALSDASRQLRELPDQPSDIMCINFDDFYSAFCRDEESSELYKALCRAQYVFVDDYHDRSDRGRFEAFWTLMNARAEVGRRGTFVTSNIDPEDIGKGSDKSLTGRLLSRMKSVFYSIHFADTIDFRAEILQRAVKKAKVEAEERMETLRSELGRNKVPSWRRWLFNLWRKFKSFVKTT